MISQKRCNKCNEMKSIDDFYKHKTSRDGYQSRYKSCNHSLVERWETYNRNKANKYRLKYSRSLRDRAILKLGRKCCQCGFDDPRALQIDHVNNDGNVERCRVKNQNRVGRVSILQKVLKDTEGRYQLLCANCNTIKAYENNLVRLSNDESLKTVGA